MVTRQVAFVGEVGASPLCVRVESSLAWAARVSSLTLEFHCQRLLGTGMCFERHVEGCCFDCGCQEHRGRTASRKTAKEVEREEMEAKGLALKERASNRKREE